MSKNYYRHDRKNYDRKNHDRNRNHDRDRERKSFNPLFAVRVNAGLKKMTVPEATLKEMGIDPSYVKQNKKGNTIISLKVSPETGLVLNPGIRPNYWQMSTKEFKRGNFAQVVAGENGMKLKGGLGRNGEVYFSVGQSRPLYLIQVHEGKDYVVIRRYRLSKNEDGDQNYLMMDQLLPSKDHPKNEFAEAYHLSLQRLIDVMRGHLPEELKFLAEAVTAALEKVHADEDYPAYAEIREPRQETEQKSDEETEKTPSKEEKTEETKEEIPEDKPQEPKQKEVPPEKPKEPKDEAESKAAKEIKAAKEKAEKKAAKKEIEESITQEDDKGTVQSKSEVDKAELEKVQKKAKEGFKSTVFVDALKGVKVVPKDEKKGQKKTASPRTKKK